MSLSTAEHRGLLVEWTAIRTFLLAGNATFTLLSTRTGTRYTYRVRVPKKSKNPSGVGPYFVSLLRGQDNENDYAYMGVLDAGFAFRATAKSRVSAAAESHKALAWFLERLRKGGPPCAAVEFWHEGACCRCGRKLTVPSSVKDGVGSECRRKVTA